MTAQILILPVIRKDTPGEAGQAVLVRLSARDYGRLSKRANEWRVSQDEAASMMLSQTLDPRRGQ